VQLELLEDALALDNDSSNHVSFGYLAGLGWNRRQSDAPLEPRWARWFTQLSRCVVVSLRQPDTRGCRPAHVRRVSEIPPGQRGERYSNFVDISAYLGAGVAAGLGQHLP